MKPITLLTIAGVIIVAAIYSGVFNAKADGMYEPFIGTWVGTDSTGLTYTIEFDFGGSAVYRSTTESWYLAWTRTDDNQIVLRSIDGRHTFTDYASTYNYSPTGDILYKNCRALNGQKMVQSTLHRI
jgi:hypothetical protein